MRRAAAILLVLLIVVLVVAGLAWSLRPPEGPQPRERSFTLTGVSVIQPGEGRSDGVNLHVAGGKIAGVSRGSVTKQSAVPSLEGGFVLPGIVDMHTHLPSKTSLRLTELFGILYALHGITAVRDAGDIDGTAVAAARRAYDMEGAVGPRVFSCGPFVGGGTARWENTVLVDDVEKAPGVARRLKQEGRACLKIYDGLDAPLVRALADAARKEGLTPIGHVPFGLTMETAGVPEIQHLMGTARPETIAGGDHVVHRVMDWSGVDDARIAEVAAASRRLGIAHTPTLASTAQLLLFLDYENGRRSSEALKMPPLFRDVVWNPQKGLAPYRSFGLKDAAMIRDTLAKKLKTVRALDEAGAALFIGTDTLQPFVVPGISAWQEMKLFVQAGVPADKVWQYATTRATGTLPMPLLGRVEAGSPADFAVYRKDPTADIDALDSLAAVSLQGRLYLREDLEAALQRYLDWYDHPLLNWFASRKARSVLSEAVKSEH